MNVTRPRQPLLAANAARQARERGDTRAMKRELQRGNPYMSKWLERQGCVYLRGTGIVRVREVPR